MLIIQCLIFSVLFLYGPNPTVLGARRVAPTRGLSPWSLASYPPEGYAPPVVCRGEGGLLGGSSELAAPCIINDGYCDCAEGIDEPGTAACSSVVDHLHVSADSGFWCSHLADGTGEPIRGLLDKRIHLSFVDDGVCDCCDGSDEPPGRCKSTCTHQVDIEHAMRQRKEVLRTQGGKERRRLMKESRKLRKTYKDKLRRLKEDLQGLVEEFGRLDAHRKAEELLEGADRDAIYETEWQRKVEHDRLHGVAPKKKALPCVGWHQTRACGGYPQGEYEVACGVKIIPQAIGYCECEDEESEELFVRFPFECSHPELTCDVVCRYQGLPHILKTFSVTDPSKAIQVRQKETERWSGLKQNIENGRRKISIIEGGEYIMEDGSAYERPQAKAAREACRQHEEAMRGLEAQVEEVQAAVRASGRPDTVYLLSLRRKCWVYQAWPYADTFTMCLYGNVTKVSNRTGDITQLGRWSGFYPLDYRRGLFAEGDVCPRKVLGDIHYTTTVYFECSLVSALVHVQEYVRCEYIMRFETPGACEP